jgi:hypothetical protein
VSNRQIEGTLSSRKMAGGSTVSFSLWQFGASIPSPRIRHRTTGELVPVVYPSRQKVPSFESADLRQR